MFEKAEYLNKFTVVQSKQTKDQALADDVYHYFGKKLPFPRIMRMIKDKGYQAIYEFWTEVRKSDCDNQLALFIWKVKENKINWKIQ